MCLFLYLLRFALLGSEPTLGLGVDPAACLVLFRFGELSFSEGVVVAIKLAAPPDNRNVALRESVFEDEPGESNIVNKNKSNTLKSCFSITRFANSYKKNL